VNTNQSDSAIVTVYSFELQVNLSEIQTSSAAAANISADKSTAGVPAVFSILNGTESTVLINEKENVRY
jgi:hypothetical protein